MHGGMPCSRWSVLPEKMILMRQISVPCASCGGAADSASREGRGAFSKVGLGRTAIGEPSRKPASSTGGHKFRGRGGCLGAAESAGKEFADGRGRQNG